MNNTERQVVLLQAVHACRPEAYGVPIRDHIRERHGTDWSYGRIYTMLEKLEAAGTVRGEDVPGGPERGYRKKRLYWLTDSGLRAMMGSAVDQQTGSAVFAWG